MPIDRQVALARRSYEGLAVEMLPAEPPGNSPDDFTLYVHGKERRAGHRAQRQLLFFLLGRPGAVYTFEHLCGALGLKGRNAARDKLTLGEHARRCRALLKSFKLPLCITLAPGLGYALCRIASNERAEPQRQKKEGAKAGAAPVSD